MAFSYRNVVVLSDALRAAEAHLGVQKHSGLHAKKRSCKKLQRKSEKPVGGPGDVVQSQCLIFWLKVVSFRGR